MSPRAFLFTLFAAFARALLIHGSAEALRVILGRLAPAVDQLERRIGSVCRSEVRNPLAARIAHRVHRVAQRPRRPCRSLHPHPGRIGTPQSPTSQVRIVPAALNDAHGTGMSSIFA
jgi:hypothetical protein